MNSEREFFADVQSVAKLIQAAVVKSAPCHQKSLRHGPAGRSPLDVSSGPELRAEDRVPDQRLVSGYRL